MATVSALRIADKPRPNGRSNGKASKSNGKPRVHRPSKNDIAKYKRLEARRLKLARQVSAIAAEVDKYTDSFMLYVKSMTKGKRVKSVRRCGHIFSLVAGQVRPMWKSEYIESLGEEAAQEVIANTPPSIVLSVEPA